MGAGRLSDSDGRRRVPALCRRKPRLPRRRPRQTAARRVGNPRLPPQTSIRSYRTYSRTRSVSPAGQAFYRRTNKKRLTSFPWRTAGASASCRGTATARAIRRLDDYPYQEGKLWDPYNQNILKGDYPIMGQNTFLNITGESLTVLNAREVPTQTSPFESTSRPHEFEFFGRPGQFFYNQNFSLSFDLFHGDAAFKPVDWRVLHHAGFQHQQPESQRIGPGQPGRAQRHRPRPHLLRPAGMVRRDASSPTSAPTTISCRCALARSRSPATSAASSSAT